MKKNLILEKYNQNIKDYFGYLFYFKNNDVQPLWLQQYSFDDYDENGFYFYFFNDVVIDKSFINNLLKETDLYSCLMTIDDYKIDLVDSIVHIKIDNISLQEQSYEYLKIFLKPQNVIRYYCDYNKNECYKEKII